MEKGWLLVIFEVARNGVAYRITQLFPSIGLCEDRVSRCARRESSLRRFFDEKNDLLEHVRSLRLLRRLYLDLHNRGIPRVPVKIQNWVSILSGGSHRFTGRR